MCEYWNVADGTVCVMFVGAVVRAAASYSNVRP